MSAFRAQVQRAKDVYHPVKLNCQGGKDSWNFKQCVEVCIHIYVILTLSSILRRLKLQMKLESPFALRQYKLHKFYSCEKHRGRPTFNPWQTRDLVASVPDLRLTADLSHWVCVCERLLSDKGCFFSSKYVPRRRRNHSTNCPKSFSYSCKSWI